MGNPVLHAVIDGRVKILNERDRHSLKRLVKKNRHSSVQMITSEFNEGTKKVSPCTICRELKNMHLRKCKSTKKPLVSATNQKKCLEFAQNHRNWTVEQWKKVMWSDESRFTLFQNDGCIRVWREPHEAMDPSCTTLDPSSIWRQCNDLGLFLLVWARFCY